MGVGLVSLLVAEEKRRRTKTASALSAKKPEICQEEPLVTPAEASVLETVRRDSPCRSSGGNFSHDKIAWRLLVESDADIAHLTSILAEYGEHFVDELAQCYLAGIDDKTRLPGIIENIIAGAKRQTSSRTMSGRKVDRHSLASETSSQNDQPSDWFITNVPKVGTGPPANEEASANKVVNEPSIVFLRWIPPCLNGEGCLQR